MDVGSQNLESNKSSPSSRVSKSRDPRDLVAVEASLNQVSKSLKTAHIKPAPWTLFSGGKSALSFLSFHTYI